MAKIEKLLLPFYGYVELGMYAEANDELESLPAEFKDHPSVLLARLELLMEMDQWEEGAALAESLRVRRPEEFEFHFKAAFCLHELKRTQEAKDTLLSAPQKIRDTALYHYNLACYECQLGHLTQANALLVACFRLDQRYQDGALQDPDLQPLWDKVGKRDRSATKSQNLD